MNVTIVREMGIPYHAICPDIEKYVPMRKIKIMNGDEEITKDVCVKTGSTDFCLNCEKRRRY